MDKPLISEILATANKLGSKEKKDRLFTGARLYCSKRHSTYWLR